MDFSVSPFQNSESAFNYSSYSSEGGSLNFVEGKRKRKNATLSVTESESAYKKVSKKNKKSKKGKKTKQSHKLSRSDSDSDDLELLNNSENGSVKGLFNLEQATPSNVEYGIDSSDSDDESTVMSATSEYARKKSRKDRKKRKHKKNKVNYQQSNLERAIIERLPASYNGPLPSVYANSLPEPGGMGAGFGMPLMAPNMQMPMEMGMGMNQPINFQTPPMDYGMGLQNPGYNFSGMEGYDMRGFPVDQQQYQNIDMNSLQAQMYNGTNQLGGAKKKRYSLKKVQEAN